MTDDPDMNSQEITAFRRAAKHKYGPRSEWPDFVRVQYEAMEEANAKLRERLDA